jgi:hypothetical protein
MPIAPQNIGSTAPKSGTYQFSEHRVQGLPFIIPVSAGVTSCSNRRIVTIQEDSNQNRFAVLSPIAYNYMTIIGWGVLEEALQSGGISSIAPTPNTFVNGDTVTVLRGVGETYMIDNDPSRPSDFSSSERRPHPVTRFCLQVSARCPDDKPTRTKHVFLSAERRCYAVRQGENKCVELND